MHPINLSILISGSGTNLEALLQAIREEGIPARVVQVISSDPTSYGLVRAKNHGIPGRVLPKRQPADNGTAGVEKKMLVWLQEAETELVILAGYLKKVPDVVLQAYPNRIMNIHPSLIPAFSGPGWYGCKVHEGVWERGVKVTGATVHFVNEEMDGGPIILQETVMLENGDDPESIRQKVLAVEHRLLPRAVSLFAAGKLLVTGRRVTLLEEVNEE
jgi:phosphoribosylglycinamide formyltransferase 1